MVLEYQTSSCLVQRFLLYIWNVRVCLLIVTNLHWCLAKCCFQSCRGILPRDLAKTFVSHTFRLPSPWIVPFIISSSFWFLPHVKGWTLDLSTTPIVANLKCAMKGLSVLRILYSLDLCLVTSKVSSQTTPNPWRLIRAQFLRVPIGTTLLRCLIKIIHICLCLCGVSETLTTG